MDQAGDDEQCDSIYANDETSDLINIEEQLKEKSLDQLLKEDRDHMKEADKQVQWYHGRITRDVAEDILNKGIVKYGNINGLFIVRESSFSSSSFVLSLISGGTYYHFQINEVKTTHFNIDDGPVSQGLDTLIQNYQEDIHGLPSQLTQFCKCKPPPNCFRRKGVTNLLHRAVLSENSRIVQQILEHKHCPTLDAKNEWGSTALHDACYYGFEDIAEALIKKGAEVKSFDKNGQTPLHVCITREIDLYWSWVPGLPRKLYWPVRVISWDGLKVKVFCKADNAILQFCSEYYSKSISDETDINENADDPMIDAGEPKDDEGVSKTIKSENCCIYDRQVARLCHKFHAVLMRCCQNNKGGVISILVKVGKANLIERNPRSGWTALHQAAFKGHVDCVKLLLDYRSPYLPRAEDDTTPLDLAEQYEYKNCFDEIDKFEPPKVNVQKKDWFHPELDRQGAQKLLEYRGLREGMFLVRSSKKDPDWHVLTMCHDQKVFNYEIKTKHYRDRMMHYIDDGPYYKSIEHLLQYYSYNGNGLPCTLVVSLNPAKELVQIIDEEDYSNLVDRQIPVPSTPVLPPRPVDDYAAANQKRKSGTDVNPPKSPTHHTPPPPTTPPPPPNHPPPSLVKSSSVQEEPSTLTRIDSKHLTIGNIIGEGEFGSVVKGVYKKQTGKKKEKIDVAIKLFHKNSINNPTEFLKEAKTMQQLHHDYIVNFLGISESENHELMLVEEYIAMGSMLDYLCEYMNKITKTDMYLWASQIACGMMYLEEKKMVHRDLAARNILLQSKHKAKISDFGLSRAVGTNSDYYKATTGGKWPIKWYAPECVNYGHFSSASDVWSFGVTLWEMFSFGEPPYGEKKAVEVIKFIEEGNRLEKPEKCPDVAYKQMLKCWEKEKENRPTFKELNTHFQGHEEYVSARDLMKRKK